MSAVAYALGVVAVALLPSYAVLPLLLVSGAAWIGTLTTLNASIQLSLAPWVRARGMSAFLLVFMGTQAVGSFVWGLAASYVGLAGALFISAAMLGVTAASITLLPLRPATGTLPRGVSTAWPTPVVVFGPEPDDGPVIIVKTYRVKPETVAEFEGAMGAVGRARRRTGGYSWGLYRDGSDPQLRVERFTVPSWNEFERQHAERWTDSDHDLISVALSYTESGTTETEQQLFALGSTGSEARRGVATVPET